MHNLGSTKLSRCLSEKYCLGIGAAARSENGNAHDTDVFSVPAAIGDDIMISTLNLKMSWRSFAHD